MRTETRRPIPLPLVLFIFALLCGSVSARAQSPSGVADDEDAQPTPLLSVSVALGKDGLAHANFFAIGQPSNAQEIKSALESSLGCTLQADAPFLHIDAQVYNGSCHPAFRGTSTIREFKIATAPLRKYALDHQIEILTLTLQLPDVEIADTQPPVKAQPVALGKAWGKMPRALSRNLELNHSYSWHTGDAIPDFVTVRFGLSPSSVARSGYILLAVLLLPALLIFWMGRKALGSEAQDKAVVWFAYMRYLQWTLNLSLLGWWIAADSLHLAQNLRFLSAGTRIAPAWDYPVTPSIVNWVPPILMWILCFALSHPVQEKLRGLSWTRAELALQAFYSCCVSLLPLAMMFTGISSLATSSFRVAVLWFVGAYAVRIIAARARLKFLGMQPQALTTGDLRDRAFAMARQAGVKLQQIYIIPSGKGQMANAFARSGNVISFTDFLLQRMTRREVDYVLGHELSHLKLGHPGKLAGAAVVSYFVALSGVGFLDGFFHLSIITRYALILGFVTLVPYFWSRRFEYAADAGSVELTGDPQAAISALFKIAQLNMLPIHWSNWTEKWITHPSSLRRAQSIAQKAGIPIEQVPAIAQAAAAPADAYYVLPATILPGSKVHSTQNKQSGSLRTALLMLATIIFTPAIFALIASHTGPDLRLRGALYFAGCAAALGMYYVFANFVPPMRLRSLAASLNTKFAKEHILADAWDGIPVGFSPAAAPRIYEANTNWDLGYLFIRSDRICYWGEETKFSLRTDHVTAITLAPGMPGMLSPLRIYFAWKDDQRGTSGVFNIGCINGSSTLQLRKETSVLAERLKTWWKTSASPKPLPEPLADLTSPALGVVTGGVPGKGMSAQKVLKELISVAILATIGAVLCGLPFHLLSFVFSAVNPPLAKLAVFQSPGAGWYVVAVASFVRFIVMIPILRYKDQALVTLAPSRAQDSHVKVPSVEESRSANPELDKVFSR